MFLQSCLFVSSACQDMLQPAFYGFGACPGIFKTSPVQKIPTLRQVGLQFQRSLDVSSPVGEVKPTQIFLILFVDICTQPLTFAADHRVVGPASGWTPVEHPR